MVKRRYIGDKLIPPLMTGILIMGPYKPLRTWVDEFPIPYYMEISWELIDPMAHIGIYDLLLRFGPVDWALSCQTTPTVPWWELLTD